jgi:tetratricopeptide (TPR) repeat protein
MPPGVRTRRRTLATIEKLRRALTLTSNGDRARPELLLRLARLYRELAAAHGWLAEGCECMILAPKSKPSSKRSAAQRRHGARSARYRAAAISSLSAVVRRRSPPYRRADRALCLLVEMLAPTTPTRARALYRRLLREHPKSRHLPRAHLALAEAAFSAGKHKAALALYRRVTRDPLSPLYGYALYRVGSCWLALGAPNKALLTFVRLLRAAPKLRGSSRGRSILRRETKKAVVRAYAPIGSPTQAKRFFARVGGSYAKAMLQRLASTYATRGMYGKAIEVYRGLIKARPASKRLCDWQIAIVRATIASKGRVQQARELRRLSTIQASYSRRKDVRRSRRGECARQTVRLLRDTARGWHQGR